VLFGCVVIDTVQAAFQDCPKGPNRAGS
jgi:hypothetical protein